MSGLIRDLFHAIGFHSWYYGNSFLTDNLRACVRCGITQHKGYLTGKWSTR